MTHRAKYSLVFSILAVLCWYQTWQPDRWNLLFAWTAVSFTLVALAYLLNQPAIFGKQPSGKLRPLNVALLFPYFLFAWSTWHVLRRVRREAPWHKITDRIVIARRLLNSEVPEDVDHVVDLTCEFSEPDALLQKDYQCFPILDASTPGVEQLQEWIKTISKLEGTILVHCAEGHGRSGFIVAALLLFTGQVKTVEESIQIIQSQRAKVRLNKDQRVVLERFWQSLPKIQL